MMINTALFEDFICGMTRFNFTVYGYMAIGDRAVPNIMISLAPAFEITSIFFENLPYFFLIFRHLQVYFLVPFGFKAY